LRQRAWQQELLEAAREVNCSLARQAFRLSIMTVNTARHFNRLAARQIGTMLVLLAALLLAACNETAPAQKSYGMVATANVHASEAAAEMLRKGGTATDAAIAAQLVLTLTEPQSSGIGGGLFSVHYDASNGAMTTFDGRETAPKAATERLFLKPDGKPMAWLDAALGGRPVGVPGVIAALHLQHSKFGKLSWFELFQPAIRLAEAGFKVSPRLSAAIADAEELEQDAAAGALYYLPDDAGDKAGEPVPAGYLLKNPAYAKTLKLIAETGPDGFYKGEVAEAIVAAVTGHEINPGLMTLDDLAGYKAVERAAICVPYRVWQVCGMGPPSSGGLTTGMILSMLEPYSMSAFDPRGVMAAHLFAQASRLAFADRNKYMADMDFVDVPVAGLTDRAYLRSRARLINPLKDMGEAAPGTPPGLVSEQKAADASLVEYGTSHLAIIDRYGNAVSMTMSVERGFGSRITAAGFVLNNQLTDFSFVPSFGGNKVANRPEGGKRPRSSMSPSIVLNDDGTLFAAVGSPGGSRIIGFTARAILGVTDWGLTMQEAVSLPHVINRNGKTTEIENTASGSGLDGELRQFGKLAAPLADMGYEIEVTALNSGLQGIRRLPDGTLDGGADPRREGVVITVDEAD
jgi:gamma-glutamyltranspeptidase/glutathione hydrolase